MAPLSVRCHMFWRDKPGFRVSAIILQAKVYSPGCISEGFPFKQPSQGQALQSSGCTEKELVCQGTAAALSAFPLLISPFTNQAQKHITFPPPPTRAHFFFSTSPQLPPVGYLGTSRLGMFLFWCKVVLTRGHPLSTVGISGQAPVCAPVHCSHIK